MKHDDRYDAPPPSCPACADAVALASQYEAVMEPVPYALARAIEECGCRR